MALQGKNYGGDTNLQGFQRPTARGLAFGAGQYEAGWQCHGHICCCLARAQGDALQQETLPRCEMTTLHFEIIGEKLGECHQRGGRWMEWKQGGKVVVHYEEEQVWYGLLILY